MSLSGSVAKPGPDSGHSAPAASHVAGAQAGVREDFQKQGLLGTLTLGCPLARGTDGWPKMLPW